MAKLFNLGIYSAQRSIFEGKVCSLIAPSECGYLGILADHAPLVARLVRGKLILKDNDGNGRVIDNPAFGFLQVGKDQTRVFL